MKRVIPLIAQVPVPEQQAWLAALRPALPDCEIQPLEHVTAEQRAQVEVAIVANPTSADLATLPRLKWVHSLWAGVENLVVATQARDVVIVRMTDPQLAQTMAEAVLAWTLYLHRDMPHYRAQQTARRWQPRPLYRPHERTVGVLGLGNLGRAAAHTLLNHGFRVYGWSRSPASLAGGVALHGEVGFSQVLRHSQILVCLLPLTSSTQGLLNHKTLALLPPGATLINFARGPLVETTALIAALDAGHLEHAVLDVFDEEPLPSSSPLWGHPRVTILPHIAAPTHKPTAAQMVADTINRFLATGDLPSGVDKSLGY